MSPNTDVQKRKAPQPSITRTNHDGIMICLGAFLILFFLVAGWLAYTGKDQGQGRKFRGPVRDPGASEVVGGSRLAQAPYIEGMAGGGCAAKRFPLREARA